MKIKAIYYFWIEILLIFLAIGLWSANPAEAINSVALILLGILLLIVIKIRSTSYLRNNIRRKREYDIGFSSFLILIGIIVLYIYPLEKLFGLISIFIGIIMFIIILY